MKHGTGIKGQLNFISLIKTLPHSLLLSYRDLLNPEEVQDDTQRILFGETVVETMKGFQAAPDLRLGLHICFCLWKGLQGSAISA